jgi:COP9 signalosome complex subunit 2
VRQYVRHGREVDRLSTANRATIMDDPFIQSHIADVLRSLRTQWIVDIIRPYTRVEIGYLADVRAFASR